MKSLSVRSSVWAVTMTTLLVCLLLGMADGRRSRRLRHRGGKGARNPRANVTGDAGLASNSAEMSRGQASEVLRQKLLQNSVRGGVGGGGGGGQGASQSSPSLPPFPFLSHRAPQSGGTLPLMVDIPLREDNATYTLHGQAQPLANDDLLVQQLRGSRGQDGDDDGPLGVSRPGTPLRNAKRRRDALLHGQRAIKGSRKAFVVTKKTYLRKEWCKTQPLRQVIREKGCLRTTILNNFCYGQCNSFFIPRSGRKGAKPAFMSCGYCKPRRIRHIRVTLKCPSRKGQKFKRKRVQFIKQCRCMAQPVQFP